MSGTETTPSARTTGAWERLNPDGQRSRRWKLEADAKASGLTILLAEDEPAIRNLAVKVLRSYGYIVLEAVDGLEALEVAERHPGPIHLLLTDWCMPRLDGGGLIRRLRDGRPETAVLVMSGYMNGELPPKSALLRKPFNSQALVESVNGAIQGQ